MTLLLHEIGHSALYFLLAILVFHLLKLKVFPWIDALIGYVVSIGLDADHLFDYFKCEGFTQFNLKTFLSGDYFGKSGQVIVPLHAWEWFVILLLLYFLTKKKYKIIVFVAAALAAQLIFDTFSHGFDPRVYSIIYRGLLGFPQEIFTSVLYN